MRHLSTKTVLSAAALCLATSLASAQVCSEWLWSNPLPQGNRLNGVAFGNGTFVAVGANGTVLTSPGGASWTPRFPDTKADLFDVAWTGSSFVAVGSGGDAFTSFSGVFWTRPPPGSAATLRQLVSAGSLLVAVGDSG